MTWRLCKMSYGFVIDVESMGIHGQGFAVGYVVQDENRNEVASALYSAPSDLARGDHYDREWVKKHVEPHLPKYPTHSSLLAMRTAFWEDWLYWRERGAEGWADCLWPVEARFLNACVDDYYDLPERGHDSSIKRSRKDKGPYPFHEIATVMLMAGWNPTANYPRLPNELPKHNPLADARQSARLLYEATLQL